MNPSMYLVAVLALCALPSALGLMCYECTSNVTAGELCNNMSTYQTVNCTGAGNECAMTTIETNATNPAIPAYILACVKAPQNCSSYKADVCAQVSMGAMDLGHGVTKCETSCCSDMDKCAMGPTQPTTATGTGTATGTATGTGSTAMSTTAAAVTFRPELIGLLLTVLSAVYFGVQ